MPAEQVRLDEARDQKAAWKKWGPYLSERQWGTVREDYSENGNAWNYFSHDHACSRAYGWGDDGLRGHLRCQRKGKRKPRGAVEIGKVKLSAIVNPLSPLLCQTRFSKVLRIRN